MASKQNTKAIHAWTLEHTDMIRFRARKEERLPERLQMVVDQGIAKSKQAYILEVLRKALELDGIPELKEE